MINNNKTLAAIISQSFRDIELKICISSHGAHWNGKSHWALLFSKVGYPWSPDTLLYSVQCVSLNRIVPGYPIPIPSAALFASFISCSLSHQSNKTESVLFTPFV